jgi:hypothetical protein
MDFYEKLRQQTSDMLKLAQTAIGMQPMLAVPALVVLYALVDGMAWLYMPDGQDDVTKVDFEAWARDFLDPRARLHCTKMDLYGARCAVVHSQIMDSRLARQSSATHVWYQIQRDGILLAPLRQVSNAEPVTTGVEQLADTVGDGVAQFLRRVSEDSDLRRRVEGRVALYFDELRSV